MLWHRILECYLPYNSIVISMAPAMDLVNEKVEVAVAISSERKPGLQHNQRRLKVRTNTDHRYNSLHHHSRPANISSKTDESS